MATLQQIEKAITQVPVITEGLITNEMKSQIEGKIVEFNEKKEKTKFIKVPFVGSFNAGKSSLMNILSCKPGLLPTDIVPETAISYEMYYDTNERVELYKNGVKIDQKDISDIANLSTEPGEVARVYIDSPSIKKYCEKGIILVDMPGIGSGIERHDAAIFNYISEGTVFILFVAAAKGGINASTLSFIKELMKYQLAPAIVITKTDVVGVDIDDIADDIEFQVKQVGVDSAVKRVCAVNNDIGELLSFLDGLNVDSIKAKRLSGFVKSVVSSTISHLKIRSDIRSKDVENINGIILELENRINDFKAESPLGDGYGDTPEQSTEDILNNVRVALRENAEDIARMVVGSANEEEIKETIIRIIRAEIITSLKEESEQYASEISNSANDIVQALLNLDIDTQDGSNVDSSVTEFMSKIELLLEYLPEKYQDIARTILGLLPFLRDIVNFVLDIFGINEEERIARVQNGFNERAVPMVLDRLRPTILDVVTENQDRIREQITQDLIEKAEQYKNGLLEKIEDAQKTQQEVENEIAAINSAIEQLQDMLNFD